MARLVGFLLVLFVSACRSQASPAIIVQNIQNTETVTATSIPPTETATLFSPPTTTPLPALTIDPALVTNVPATIAATSIPQQSSGATEDPCNKPLTSWQGPTARFSITNETKPEGKIVLSLYVVTPLAECGSLTDLSSGPVGMYSARAFVDGKTSFKVYGNFQIQEGSWNIVVRNNKIIALGNCYPSC